MSCNKPKFSIVWIIVISVLLGALGAYLYSIGAFPFISLVMVVTTITGLIFSIFNAMTIINCRASRFCLRKYMPITFFASLALLALSAFALGVLLTPIFFATVILVFLVASVFFMSIIGTFILFKCFMDRSE